MKKLMKFLVMTRSKPDAIKIIIQSLTKSVIEAGHIYVKKKGTSIKISDRPPELSSCIP